MNVLVFPLMVPLMTAVIGLVWRRPSVFRRWFFGVSAFFQICVSFLIFYVAMNLGVVSLPMGGWVAPYGITLTVDILGAIMVFLCTLVSLTAMVYGFSDSSSRSEHFLRLPLVQFLVAGVNLSFLTGDFFNLFVAFEIMLISSYALLTSENSERGLKQVLPYLGINVVGGTLFFCAGGLFYSLFGSLNFATISQQAALMATDSRLLIAALLVIFVFGLKAGFFPLYYWLPNSYPTLPAPVAALFSAMLTKVGVYAILRMFGTVLPHSLDIAHYVILVLAAPTMIFGIFSAVSRGYIRGILCFNLVSHIGFMMMAIGIFTLDSIAACIYYMMHHVVVIASLFLIGGVAQKLVGSDDLSEMGSLWRTAPWLGALFVVQGFSLAGLPPFSGFWGKFLIIKEGMKGEYYFWVACILIASILTLMSILKVIFDGFWTEREELKVTKTSRTFAMTVVTSLLVFVSLGIGLDAEYFMQVSYKASKLLMSPDVYSLIVMSQNGGGF